MKQKGMLFVAVVFAWFAGSNGLLAADLIIQHSIVTQRTIGDQVTGVLRVEVHNLSATSRRNVNVRLASPPPNSIERGLFQFDNISAGQVGVTEGQFLFEPALANGDHSILWHIDYDDTDGVHHDLVIAGTKGQP